MNILIIEDEARASRRLARLIQRVAPQFNIVAQTESVAQSIDFLQKEPNIQLIFSDIELGDGTSFEIFRKVQCETPIIFTTAYNQYAIEAFKVNGVDYLLKPIDENDLAKAIEKYRRNFSTQSVPDIQALSNLMHQLQGTSYKNRFLVKVGDKLKSIQTTEIAAFYSMAKSTFLLTKTKRNYAVDQPLDQLIKELEPAQFFKISRKHIVSLDALDEILVHSNSRLLLRIKGLENQEVVVAREKVKDFKLWLGENHRD